MGLWNGIERVITESNDNGELAVICGVYWEENEQDWSIVQFISTATVLSVQFYFYLIYIHRKMEFNSLFTRLNQGKGVGVP